MDFLLVLSFIIALLISVMAIVYVIFNLAETYNVIKYIIYKITHRYKITDDFFIKINSYKYDLKYIKLETVYISENNIQHLHPVFFFTNGTYTPSLIEQKHFNNQRASTITYICKTLSINSKQLIYSNDRNDIIIHVSGLILVDGNITPQLIKDKDSRYRKNEVM